MSTVIGIDETWTPSGNLYPVGNCIKQNFIPSTPQIIIEGVDTPETGTLATLTIPSDVLGNVQEGSTITINGVTFTYTATPPALPANLANNILEIQTAALNALNLSTYITNNIQLSKSMTAVLNVDTVELTAKECGVCLEVTATNLSLPLSTQTIEDCGTALNLKDDFRISACYTVSGSEVAELQVFPRFTKTADKCDIDTVEICQDISEVMACELSKELPQYDLQFMRLLPNNAKLVTVDFGVRWGNPLNSFWTCDSRNTYKIINGAYQNDDTDRFQRYSGETNFDLISSYNAAINEDTEVYICEKQKFFAYLDTSLSAVTISMTLGLRDKNGNVVMNLSIPSLPASTGQTVEMNLTPCDVLDYAVAQGAITDPDEIKSFNATIVQSSGSGVISTLNNSYTINFDCCDCSTTFLFCSSLGVYETISTKCFDKEFVSVVREFIEVCEPCEPTSESRGAKTTNATASKEIEVFHWDEQDDKFNPRLITELMASKNVYLIQNGKYYAVQPVTDNVQLSKRFENIDKSFRFRLMNYRNF